MEWALVKSHLLSHFLTKPGDFPSHSRPSIGASYISPTDLGLPLPASLPSLLQAAHGRQESLRLPRGCNDVTSTRAAAVVQTEGKGNGR